MTQDQIARCYNEWMRRYVEEPDRFEREATTIREFLADERNGVEPSYGVEGAAYTAKIAKDLGIS